MKPTRHPVLLALVSLPLAAGLTACGGSADSKASNASAGSVAAEPAPASARDEAATRDFASDGDAGKSGAAPAAATVIARSVIATGQLRLSSRHLADARQDAINLATGLHGFVANEQSQSDSRGHLDRVDLTLRVPAASFEKALDGLAALGTVRARTQSVEDVTTQVIDNEARVRAQKASVASIQRLLARATTIAEIMSIESQLSSRQAELDSLEQQQKWLADQTSMSTITVTVTRPPKHGDVTSTGFLGGLERGWNALGTSAAAVATAVGAVIPFGAVLAIVGIPVWLVVRRRRSLPPAQTAATAD